MKPLRLFFIFFLTFIYSFVRAENYDFDQIHDFLNRNLQCLENFGALSSYATFQVVLAQGFLHEIHVHSLEKLNEKKKQDILVIEKRLSNIIELGLKANPDDLTSVIWNSQYFAQLGDFKFKYGTVPENGTVNKSLMQIVEEMSLNDYVKNCMNDLFTSNPPSNGLRNCIENCYEVMTDLNETPDISFDNKMRYLGYQFTLNCTDPSSPGFKRRTTKLCTHLLNEINTMLKYKGTEEFDDAMTHLMSKVHICASWGIPEFLSRHITLPVFNRLDCDGCMKGNNIEDTKILSAKATGILTLALWLVVEEDTRYNLL